MKKLPIFLAGALVGAVVMTAGSALADGIKSLVNEKVGSVWELNINGEAVGEIPIIKGSSYAPVRQIAELAGMDVDFEPGKVYLTTKEVGNEVGVVTGEKTTEVLESEIRTKKVLLQSWKDDVIAHKESIRDVPNLENVAAQEAKIIEANKAIKKLESEILELEVQIAALNAE